MIAGSIPAVTTRFQNLHGCLLRCVGKFGNPRALGARDRRFEPGRTDWDDFPLSELFTETRSQHAACSVGVSHATL